MRKFVKINNNNIKNTIKRHYSSELKNELSHLIPEKRERINKIKFLLNDKVIDNVSANQLIGGMRGIKCMLWDNSSLDSEKGITLLEAIVSTAIIGIGFVAVFQMVQYSVRSIDVSRERTKSYLLISMVAEDLISEKNSTSPTSKVSFVDYLVSEEKKGKASWNSAT